MEIANYCIMAILIASTFLTVITILGLAALSLYNVFKRIK